jgi:hypothetical protein
MKRSTLLFAAGAAVILLSGKKKKRSAPSIPEETQEEPEIEVDPDPDPDPEPDTVPEPEGFQCERMLYNGYCIETWTAPNLMGLGLTWMVTIKNADGTKVDPPDFTLMPVPAPSEGAALDWAYSKIDGWT